MAGAMASTAQVEFHEAIGLSPLQIRPDAPFGVHLCFGDLNNKALITQPSLTPAVRFTNELVKRWPATHQLDYVHMPLAEADLAPTTDPGWYAPLADLELPPDCRLVAGFVHDKLDDDGHDRLMALLDDLLGSRVDVASSDWAANTSSFGWKSDAM